MTQGSALMCMCKVLAWALGLAVASFIYPLCVCGTCTMGYFMGLGMAFFVFIMSVFAGVVLYLE